MFDKAFQALEPHLDKIPQYYTAKGCIGAMFALIYLSKFAHAGLCLLLTAKYDNVQSSYRNGGTGEDILPHYPFIFPPF
jgi:hypothetical protein